MTLGEAAIDRACRVLRSRSRSGVWEGKGPTRYFDSCRVAVPLTPETACIALFTRDVGHHTSGWWKNPDYERCEHLSLSFFAPTRLVGVPPTPLPRDKVVTRAFLDRLFGANKRLLWCEPPYSADGKARDVWHYRLFCDPAWQPIHPRGEVYSKELTEAGWLSFSDVQAGITAEADAANELIGNLLADAGVSP